MSNPKQREKTAPGVFIREELDARGWSQVELAEVIGCCPSQISRLITGRHSISPSMAIALGDAFGTSAQYWMNLKTNYALEMAADADPEIARRRIKKEETNDGKHATLAT